MFLREIKNTQSLSPPRVGWAESNIYKTFFHFASVKKFNLFSWAEREHFSFIEI